MNQAVDFLRPRLVGDRFSGHLIPLELLRDLSVLEELIADVARWRFLEDNPGRKRLPRGFSEDATLSLAGIEAGSAVVRLVLFVASASMVPTQAQLYYEQARDSIVSAIGAAERGGHPQEHLPLELLAHFDRFGRSLREGEAIEFTSKDRAEAARLTRESRRRLIFASSQVQDITEEITLRGTIPAVDRQKKTFTILTVSGERALAPIATPHFSMILEAFNGYASGVKVLLRGIGRFNRNERLMQVESVERLSLLDTNDVGYRLEELLQLKDGWLDGKNGLPIAEEGLEWFGNAFRANTPEGFPLPYLYPTAEGGIQAEWSVNGLKISLEVDLKSHVGEFQSLDVITAKATDKTLDLNDLSAWQWLALQLPLGSEWQS